MISKVMQQQMNYSRGLKITLLTLCLADILFIVAAFVWFYFGGKNEPWVLLAFIVFQIPFVVCAIISKLQFENFDPVRDEVMRRAFETGKITIANVDEDGKVTYSELDKNV